MSTAVHAARRHAVRIVLAQIAVTCVIAVVCAAALDVRAGLAALIGGGIGVLATAYMAFAMLKAGAGADAARIARSFFVGWAVKIMLTVALLVIAFRSQMLAPVPLLAAYIATFVSFWAVATWGAPDGQAIERGSRTNDGRANGSRRS